MPAASTAKGRVVSISSRTAGSAKVEDLPDAGLAHQPGDGATQVVAVVLRELAGLRDGGEVDVGEWRSSSRPLSPPFRKVSAAGDPP